MPQRQLPGQGMPPSTHGPVNEVPCPHCGKPQDLRELDSQQLLDTGHDIVCEFCQRVYIVCRIVMVKVVALKPSMTPARQSQQAAQPARTIGPRVLNKLLGRGR